MALVQNYTARSDAGDLVVLLLGGRQQTPASLTIQGHSLNIFPMKHEGHFENPRWRGSFLHK